MSILNYVKSLICTSNNTPNLEVLVNDIANNVNVIKEYHTNKKSQINRYIKLLEKEKLEREREQALFVSVIDHIDDMVWAKDLDGRYIVANKAFREKFCYNMSWKDLKGKTDKEISEIFKNEVGNDNHTFDETFDSIVQDTENAKVFLEHGKIDGKLVKLVINKNPVYDFNGVMFATCSTGKDITKWHNDLENAIKICGKCFGKQGKHLLLEELNKIEFKEG